MKINKALR